MTLERYRHRRTVGSGPPADLPFGEIAYSDTDGLLHVGRPDGSVRSYGQSAIPDWDSIEGRPATYPPSSHLHPNTKISLTLLNGFQVLSADWKNELTVFPAMGIAFLRFAFSHPNPSITVPVLAWSPDFYPPGLSFTPHWNIGRAGQFSVSGQYLLINSAQLVWVAVGGAGTLDFCIGSAWIPYA